MEAFGRFSLLSRGLPGGQRYPLEGTLDMVRDVLADGVVLLHFAFVLYIAVGGFIAWRWPRTFYLHLGAVAWGLGIVVLGFSCPLTFLERALRGEAADAPGFIDRYVEGVLYPEELTPLLRALMAVAVAVSYAGLAAKHLPALRGRVGS